MNNIHAALIVAVISIVTIALRFIPFVLFGGRRETPGYILYLGRVLPYSIMGMLVVYCLRNAKIISPPHAFPELISCALVAALQLLKRNTLISILGGTVCYMLLVQFVF